MSRFKILLFGKKKASLLFGKVEVEAVALLAVIHGRFVGLVAEGAADLTQVVIVGIGLHFCRPRSHGGVAFVAFQAALFGSALLGEEGFMATAAGDFFQGMGPIQIFRFRPGIEIGNHGVGLFLCCLHTASLTAGQTEKPFRGLFMAGPASTSKFFAGKMAEVDGPLQGLGRSLLRMAGQALFDTFLGNLGMCLEERFV